VPFKETNKCRICGNRNLVGLLNLGEQALTGTFPKSKATKLTTGPLEIIKCMDEEHPECCGLVQLKHSYNKSELYGDNYGYRSSLNQSMVHHLKDIYEECINMCPIYPDDLIIDIGSNDGTFLNFFPEVGYHLVGIDPTAAKFKEYYNNNINIIPDFFNSEIVKKHYTNKKAKIISSIAMFYDLENPHEFVKDISDVLDDEGIWVFEQSYMPHMIERNAFDTICHEHLEYYGLKQIKWLLDKVDLKIIDVEFNEVNGGSFKIIAAKYASSRKECTELILDILKKEEIFSSLTPFDIFREKVIGYKKQLIELINSLKKNNKKILGYGASTKGNVILQYCGFTDKEIDCIAEVNPDKFGAYTPNTHIPIISEKEAKDMKPDYFLVFPWHFKENILEREKDTSAAGVKFIFPLPEIEIV